MCRVRPFSCRWLVSGGDSNWTASAGSVPVVQLAVSEGELGNHAVAVERLVQTLTEHLYEARACDVKGAI